jgi:hypothetical protein
MKKLALQKILPRSNQSLRRKEGKRVLKMSEIKKIMDEQNAKRYESMIYEIKRRCPNAS